jgi:O-antigen ligase
MTQRSVGPLLPRASLVLIGLAWVVPFLQPYHGYPLVSFYSEWLAFALGLGAALVLARKESWRETTMPVIALAPFGLILLLGLQLLLGRVPYPEQALTATLYLAWSILLMLLAHVFKRELGLASIVGTLSWFMLGGGLLAVLVGLLQHYQPYPALDFMIMPKASMLLYGNLGQPNHYAAHVTLALASAVFLYGRGRLPGALAAPCVALFLFVLALSGSRGPWLYFGALTALALLLYRRLRDAPSRRLAVCALWLLPAFVGAQWAAVLPLLQPQKGVVVTSLQRLFESASGIEARLQLAREAWEMFLDAPVLGAGFGEFSWHHFLSSPSRDISAVPGMYNHAHNIVVQLIAEMGLAGACLVVGAAVYWIAGLRRIALSLEWWWILASLAVIAIHSMLEYPLWYSYFLGVASILLGLGAMQVRSIRMAGAGRAMVVVALALGGFNLVAIVEPYRDFERLVFDSNRVSLPRDGQTFADAVMELHREPLLRPYVDLALTFGITPSPEDLPAKLDLNGRVMHFAPTDTVVYRHAFLLELSGEHEAALRQLELAARAYPGELDDVVRQLQDLARRHTGEFLALLELAAASRAELRRREALEEGSRRH